MRANIDSKTNLFYFNVDYVQADRANIEMKAANDNWDIGHNLLQ